MDTLTRLLPAALGFLLGVSNLNAQKKVIFSFHTGIYKSVGNNISSIHIFNERPLTINYLTRAQYRHLYYNFSLTGYYPFTDWLNAGLETGFYLNDREKFFSDTLKTVTMFTIQAGGEFALIKKKKKQFGVAGKAGLLIFNHSANNYLIHNGFVFSGAVFFKQENKGAVRLGFEKQLQNVTASFPATASYKEIKYPYSLKRMSIYLSISIDLSDIDF